MNANETARTELTDFSYALLIDYMEDAGNWSGTPWVTDSNVGWEPRWRGNITDLVKKGYIKVNGGIRDGFITFTDKAQALAEELDILLD